MQSDYIPFTYKRSIQNSFKRDPSLTNLRFLRDYLDQFIEEKTVAPEGFVRNLISGYARKVMPTVERLNELLDYNPETGKLFWKVNRSRVKAGDRAGSLNKLGYREISIDGKNFQEHQICLILATQEPLKLFDGNGYELVVDHINNVKDDNRLENLQEITVSENSAKQIREQLKLDKDGKQLGTGIIHHRNKFAVQFSIRSWWRGKTQTTGTLIYIPFDTYAEAAVFKLFMGKFPHGDKIVEALDLKNDDELILDKLYSGELAKTGKTIKYQGILPEFQHLYDAEQNFYDKLPTLH